MPPLFRQSKSGPQREPLSIEDETCSGLALLFELLDVLGGVDLEDAVAPAVTVVDDRRTAGVLVHEQEEVVADELHLIQRLIDAHGFCDMQLATDDNRGVADVNLDGLARTEISGDCGGGAVVDVLVTHDVSSLGGTNLPASTGTGV